MSSPIYYGLLLLVPAVLCTVWGLVELRAVAARGYLVYDNPLPTIGAYLFGWPGLLLLGIGLLRCSTRVAKVAGLLCLLVAATPVVIIIWQ